MIVGASKANPNARQVNYLMWGFASSPQPIRTSINMLQWSKSMSCDIELVRREIEASFKNIRRPKKEEISNDNCLEAAMVRNYFYQMEWPDVNDERIISYDGRADLSAVFAFLSDDGFRYFFPTFLVFLLRHGRTCGALLDALVWKLASGDDIVSPASFSKEQRLAVKAWLHCMQQLLLDDELFQKDIESVLKKWSSSHSA
jgi:hypothetical protein